MDKGSSLRTEDGRGAAHRSAKRGMRCAPSSAYAATVSALAIGSIGVFGLLAQQPLLFPSLGPTLFLQAVTPNSPGARCWNVVVGHALGLCIGFLALFLFKAETTPVVMTANVLSPERIAATAVAIGVTIALQTPLDAQHPPAAATTMLITLGGLKPAWSKMSSVGVGLLLVALFGSIIHILYPAFHRRQSIQYLSAIIRP
jgi:hypothetical protein